MENETLRRLVASHAGLGIDASNLGDDTDLYDAGLTSLKTVSLMLAIEDEWDIEFDDDALTKTTFRTINALASVVSRLASER